MADIHQYIKQYQKMGFSFFPLPFKEKAANIKWDTYQKRKPTEGEINAWFNGAPRNLAVVTGKISNNLVALDCDSQERFYELGNVIKEKLNLDDMLDSTWITETGRGFQYWFFVEEETRSAKFPLLDIKADGGYVVAPPSIHPLGKRYKFINPRTKLRTIPSLLTIGVDLSAKDSVALNQPGWVGKALEGVGEGQRNDMCTKLAGYFVNVVPEDVAISVLFNWNKLNTPPLPDKEIYTTVSHAYRSYDKGLRGQLGTEGTAKGTIKGTWADRVKQWVLGSDGWFGTDELDRDLGIVEPNDRENRKKVLQRMRVADEIKQNPATNRLWRRVDKDVVIMNIRDIVPPPLEIRWPFSLQDLCNIRPKNVIVIAGFPDSGKTAFCLNLVALNQLKHKIWYWCSEMGEEELAERLNNFTDVEKWTFNPSERSKNFADVIKPDAINIIDYLEISDYTQAENMIREIFDRLNTGIAVIAMQGGFGDLARGGVGTLDKPRLYLSMHNGKIKIIKAKSWKDKERNPNGMVSTFTLVNGCDFHIIRPWHYEDKEETGE